MFGLREIVHLRPIFLKLKSRAYCTVCHLYMWMEREMPMVEHGNWLEMGKCLCVFCQVSNHMSYFLRFPFGTFTPVLVLVCK